MGMFEAVSGGKFHPFSLQKCSGRMSEGYHTLTRPHIALDNALLCLWLLIIFIRKVEQKKKKKKKKSNYTLGSEEKNTKRRNEVIFSSIPISQHNTALTCHTSE